jgi:hypothetical protein
MAYVSQEMKSKLAPTIKAVLKKYKMKGTIAVRSHSTLVVNIKEGVIDFGKGYIQVNPYWIHDHYEGKAKAFLTELLDAMKGPEFFDHSDAMTDYFHRSHYQDINIGKWNKPYTVVSA